MLGDQLIGNARLALFELVKNSYDANATKVDIDFKNIGEDEGELIFELYPALDSDEFFLELSKVKDEKQIASMFKNYSGELIGPSPL